MPRARSAGLRCDIAWGENDRIYGESWIRFLNSCRATLGTESGATVADYDGSIERRVKDFLAERPAASFEDVEQAILAPYEGNVDIRVISPRQFEAAALRTALVLFPGEYSGVLTPWRHYIPLEKNFSNFDEVAERIQDLAFLDELVDQTYEEVAREERYSLRAFIQQVDDLIAEQARQRTPGRGRPSSPKRQIRRPLRTAVERRIHTTAKTAIAAGMIARRPPLRKVLGAYARDRSARRQVSASALMDDLLRLAVVADARGRPENGTAPFAVNVTYDEPRRRLVLGSTTNPAPAHVTAQAIAKPLRDGDLEIVWSHAAIGTEVRIPPTFERGFPLRVGYHGVDGAHNFRALRRLGACMPDQVLAALEPVLR